MKVVEWSVTLMAFTRVGENKGNRYLAKRMTRPGAILSISSFTAKNAEIKISILNSKTCVRRQFSGKHEFPPQHFLPRVASFPTACLFIVLYNADSSLRYFS
jgi:hypothetical protein